jgi:acyl phosphate:glycerol-3-phosphate acyltransferase
VTSFAATIAAVPAPLLAAGVFVAAYLLGGIPWALLVGKWFYHVDLRTCGSGNLGTTNAYRELGTVAGVSVFLLDCAKGVLAVAIAYWLLPSSWGDWPGVVAGFVVLLGHAYSPYLRFSGGKGVATACGVVLILTPLAWPCVMSIWAVLLLTTRRMSLASLTATATYPAFTAWLYPDRRATLAFAVCGVLLLFWRHRANIGRLWRGEEPKIGRPGSRRGRAAGVTTGTTTDEEER